MFRREKKFTHIPGDKKVQGHMEDVQMRTCDPEEPLHNLHQFLFAIYILDDQKTPKV